MSMYVKGTYSITNSLKGIANSFEHKNWLRKINNIFNMKRYNSCCLTFITNFLNLMGVSSWYLFNQNDHMLWIDLDFFLMIDEVGWKKLKPICSSPTEQKINNPQNKMISLLYKVKIHHHASWKTLIYFQAI